VRKTKQGARHWQCTPVILALGRQRKENHEFQASLGYLVRPYLKKKVKEKEKIKKEMKQKLQYII
jgi:hypothetical protein